MSGPGPETPSNDIVSNDKISNHKISNDKISNAKISNAKISNDKISNDKIKLCVREVFSNFVRDVDPAQLSDFLIQENIISVEQWQQFSTPLQTKQSQCRALLHHLFTISHPRAFLVVYEALVKDSHHLLEHFDSPSDSLDETDHESSEEKAADWSQEKEVLLLQLKELETQLNDERILSKQLRKRIQELESGFGSVLKAEDICLVGDTSPPLPVVVQTRKRLEFPGKASAVAVLEGKIYLLCSKPSSVCVFDGLNCKLLQMNASLKEMKDPFDAGSCKTSNCLYVSDAGCKCIWKITRDDLQVSCWLSNTKSPFTLSVSSDGSVLILRNRKVEIYRSDGRILGGAIQLPSDIQDARHAVRVGTGELVIGHRLRDGLWIVSRLDKNGNLIARFKPRSEEEEMSYPKYFSLDEDNDRLFVADYKNDRVILFSLQTLSWIQVLGKEESRLDCPNRLAYDRTSKNLVVVDEKGAYVWQLNKT